MRILIVKMSALGDIIHTFTVLPYLKHNYPDTEIDWVVEQPFAELVKAHPMVNRVVGVQTKKWRHAFWKGKGWGEIAAFWRELRQKKYDVVLDVQGNIKSALVTASAKSPLKVGFGQSTVPEWPNVLVTHKRYNPPEGQNIRQDYLFLVQSAFGNFTLVSEGGVKLRLNPQEEKQLDLILESLQKKAGMKIMICPGSNWTNKQLSKETLYRFLDCLVQTREVHFVFIWGNPEEKAIGEEIAKFFPQHSSVIERLSLPTLQNLMAQVDLVIAMDSLPLHLAGSTSTPTYSVFGASSAIKYKPAGSHHQAFQGECPYGKTFVKRCPILRSCQTGACIKGLEGERLYAHFNAWWQTLRG